MPEPTDKPAITSAEADALRNENAQLKSMKRDPKGHYSLSHSHAYENHGDFLRSRDDKWLKTRSDTFASELADMNISDPKTAQALWDREIGREAKSWGDRRANTDKTHKAQLEALGWKPEDLKSKRDELREIFGENEDAVKLLKLVADTDNVDNLSPALLQLFYDNITGGDESEAETGGDEQIETNPGNALAKGGSKTANKYNTAKPSAKNSVAYIDDPNLKGVFFDSKNTKEAARIYEQLTDPRNEKGERIPNPAWSRESVNKAWAKMLELTANE